MGIFFGLEVNFNFLFSIFCVGEMVIFMDVFIFVGNIEIYEWDFGIGVELCIVFGVGLYEIIYNILGLKFVVLEVILEWGCIVMWIDFIIEVVCCEDYFIGSVDIIDVVCFNSINGVIDFMVDSGYDFYGYIWSNGSNMEDFSGLLLGIYIVIVIDEVICEVEFIFMVDSFLFYVFDILVVMFICNGGVDGVVILVVSGGMLFYEYNWEGIGFGLDNMLSNISQGEYIVEVCDVNGCMFIQVLFVNELIFELDFNV